MVSRNKIKYKIDEEDFHEKETFLFKIFAFDRFELLKKN